VRRATLFGDAVHAVVHEGADRPRRCGRLQAAGSRRRVDAVRPSLEDAFIELVAGRR
jgi:hypothetical protein